MGKPQGCIDHGFHEFEPKGFESSSTDQVHKGRSCGGCGHLEHSRRCRELTMPGPPGEVDECGCTQLEPEVNIAGMCRSVGGCTKHPNPEPDTHDFVSPAHCAACMRSWVGPDTVVEGEPPLTPEEEEEAPEDVTTLPPPEGPEYTPCVACGHIEPQHSPDGGPCLGADKDCDCVAYHTAPERRCTCGETACESELCDCDSAPCPVDHTREAPEGEGFISAERWDACAEPPPPQPERRPPLLVAYSVQGHLYEVALAGDASVHAVDGALVIQHHLGPVAGIVQVLPVINEESA
jgi:hypothetical protein